MTTDSATPAAKPASSRRLAGKHLTFTLQITLQNESCAIAVPKAREIIRHQP